MLEIVLFLGLAAIMMSVSVSVYIATQESRIRQQSILQVEQQGTRTIENMTQIIRRAEKILAPPVHETGSILALQMSLNGEYPTLMAHSATGNLLLIQKTSVFSLLNKDVTIKNLTFRNIGGNNVALSFDLATTIPLAVPISFERPFGATATLFPDDQFESGGCSPCPLPSCIDHLYRWYSCEADVCTPSPVAIAC